MKKSLQLLAAAALLLGASTARATSSTTFWTPATTYVQPYLVPHLTYDTYVSERSAFQNDYGLTVGFLPFEKLQGEVGIDTFMPGLQSTNLYLNAKLGVPEGAFGEWTPGLSAGIVGVGFKSDVSNFDILHAELGKTFPVVGNLVLGGYYGLNDKLLVSSSGETNRAGLLAAWTSPDVVLNLTGLNKINFMADVQTGKNAFGAVGGGIGLYFTPAIDILTGPVFFFDSGATTMLQGPGVRGANRPDWLWTVQLDVDLDWHKLVPPAAAPKA
ncbi:MAG TPA: hypothetical protein VFE30_00295 [Anaeromyxobacteraceae bacterium]|jgi:hypothetical protein|nr:hypothetical protein [Anaeromyxobacteraceae bacterium]